MQFTEAQKAMLCAEVAAEACERHVQRLKALRRMSSAEAWAEMGHEEMIRMCRAEAITKQISEELDSLVPGSRAAMDRAVD